jgi:hypothetical protein
MCDAVQSFQNAPNLIAGGSERGWMDFKAIIHHELHENHQSLMDALDDGKRMRMSQSSAHNP